MFLKKSIYTVLLLLFLMIKSYSQTTENWLVSNADSISNGKFDSKKNTLQNTHSLFPLFTKLYRIKHFSDEKAIIVHLGDSHIQADMMTSVIRNSFQNYFGNAGRGLLFPFQVAKTNAPIDIITSSKNIWKSNRITKIDTSIACGIGAFGLETSSPNSAINFELRSINGVKDKFDKVSLFFGGNVSDIQIESNNNINYTCFESSQNYYSIDLKEFTSAFNVTFPTAKDLHFYGASVEKNNVGGVIYHSIGANGAKFSDYNKTALFWKQLPKLNADCYVISLGTNEAQDQNLSAKNFLEPVKIMVEKLRLTTPNAAIIITTPPVSYFKKLYPNPSLEIITNAIIQYCNENNIVYWDLFNSSQGSEGAKLWKANLFLNTDLVHFTKKGYVLQAELFVSAFIKTWNEFLSKN